ncbi:uncharacterized protein N7496_001930 [Penicillium cataractarum]|uniref:Uncharacterized protein n=1 Tax=Penicillium cataractarum TaxID=2100454 RepID=A0A9X0B7I9_9EURO|nr:uncharacterized protein N7496_001930 [Penicillium cataractarum]KAJ5390862.1 hypothetical protein N7496_001930 [Penicillium cataractarum]
MFQHRANEAEFLSATKNKDSRFILPGYGRPLDYAPVEKNIYGVESRSMFPSALDDRDIENGYTELPIQSLREIEMVRVMEDLTDIPEWWIKIQDPGFVEDWEKMALNGDADITPNMANWIIDELKFKAMIYETSQAVGLYNGDMTKSDSNVPISLVERLSKETKVLDYDDTELQFYYPGSWRKQRDLLAMALYPVVYGKSRILTDTTIGLDEALRFAGQGEVIPKPTETGITREDMTWRVKARSDIQVRPYSRNFQILPTDFQLGDDDRWHISSYINNLHPIRHRNIYKLIEDAFNCMIPQFNMTMTPLKDMLHSRARIEYHKAEYHPIPKSVLDKEPQIRPKEAQSEFEERYLDWRHENFKVIQPDAGVFIPWAVPPALMNKLPEDLPSAVRIERDVSLNKDYKDRGLQVITRILGVDLSPEDPYYQSDWHVEGQMNEHICAAAFLVFDNENMEEPVMEFRNIVETGSLGEVDHEANDFVWLKQVFGLANGEPAVQRPGSIKCKVGRSVIFPSTVQHRLTHFELKDKSKPGHNRALVFFLIDPNLRIISTANIPPQRLDWTLDIKGDEDKTKSIMAGLALDNKDRKGPMPMSLLEALDLRWKFLEEMMEFTKYQHVAFESPVVML